MAEAWLFVISKTSTLALGPANILFSGCHGLCLCCKNLSSLLSPVPMLQKSELVPPLPVYAFVVFLVTTSPFCVLYSLMMINLLLYIKRTNVMQLGSMFICNCNIALLVSDAFCVHLQEHLATVEAASGEW